MKLSVLGSAATAVLIAFAGPLPEASAKEKTVMVGGAAMYPSKTIVANAVNSAANTDIAFPPSGDALVPEMADASG